MKINNLIRELKIIYKQFNKIKSIQTIIINKILNLNLSITQYVMEDLGIQKYYRSNVLNIHNLYEFINNIDFILKY